MIKVSSSEQGEQNRAKAKVIHCVLENSHKVVHLGKNGQLDLEGFVVRNAADTTVSVGTFANLPNTLNSKNNVIINSMTAGILCYLYDGAINDSNAANSWNTINISGFLDIYNWKSVDSLAFIPDTELGGNQGLVASLNNIVTGEINKEEYKDLSAVVGGSKYVHMGIIKIATAYKTNGTKINFVDGINSVGYGENIFPIPGGLPQQFIKYAMMYSYYNNVEDKVGVNSTFADESNAKIYEELVMGRK